MHKCQLNGNGNFNICSEKVTKCYISIMAVNSATGLSLWHNDLFSTVGLEYWVSAFYIYHSDPQNVRTNKNFSIKSLITNLT